MAKKTVQIDTQSIESWGSQLVQLVWRHVPKIVSGVGIEDWTVAGPALVVQAAGTLETMLTLLPSRRERDATLLLRSLYENILVFSWIAIDPAVNLPRWTKTCCQNAIRTDNDWRTINTPLLDSRNRTYCETKVQDATVKFAPDNARMAEEIDTHWHYTYPGYGTLTGQDRDALTFRGMYRHTYRFGSQEVHQDLRSLNRFFTLDATGATTVHREIPGKHYLYPWLFGDHVLTVGLAIASEAIGWPRAPDVWAARQGAFAEQLADILADESQ